MLNVKKIKEDFPIFKHRSGLVYLDSPATSLKPKPVIDKLVEYYSQYSANIFRGIYDISEKATFEYEETRKITSRFINSSNEKEIIFTRNTTESLNLLANSLGRLIKKGDEIITTIMEHHSNFVPWQVLAKKKQARFKIININDQGYLDSQLEKIITKKTKILTLTFVSNVLGTINPVKKIVTAAKKINPNLITIVDAAQAVPHLKINVADLGCDFLAFSSHKMLGPTGIGVLWGKYQLLEDLSPFLYGGEMIEEVFLNKSTFKKPPHKFEAGTPAIGEVVAFKEAIKYLQAVGLENIRHHEVELTQYALNKLKQEFGKEFAPIGPTQVKDKCGVIAFNFAKYHPHDIAAILNEKNIAVRAGYHCAMPLHRRLKTEATVRISFYLYNNKQDVDKLIDGLKTVKKILD